MKEENLLKPECDAESCNNHMEWDMPAIIFDERQFCSPDCARSSLQESECLAESVVLHDPQYAVQREELDGVSEEETSMKRTVEDRDDAFSAIDEIETMFPTPFRIELDDDME